MHLRGPVKHTRSMRALTKISPLIAWVVVAATATADPQYQIYDIGVVQTGDTASQGFGVSTGGIAVGRSFQSSGTQAFTWTHGGGLVGLPNLAGRNYCRSDSANDSGIVVGTGATTAFGSARLPVVWQNGVVSQLPLPRGQTLGDANHVNASGVAVGSVNGGSSQRGVIYSGGSASIITQTTSNGSYFLTAFGINDSGRVVGQGIDPNNAAVNVGIVYDIGSNTAFSVGALPGFNGALAFAVSNTGYVVGSSMLNQGSGLPFIWSDAGGIVAIPLATGTSEGSARGVNSAGWVVGNDSSAFSIPFLYDGTTTYRLADLLPAGSGWDLSMNTSSSALGISDNGIIVGTGVHNGETHAYAMVPVTSTPTPSPTATPPPTPTPTPTGTLNTHTDTSNPDPDTDRLWRFTNANADSNGYGFTDTNGYGFTWTFRRLRSKRQRHSPRRGCSTGWQDSCRRRFFNPLTQRRSGSHAEPHCPTEPGRDARHRLQPERERPR